MAKLNLKTLSQELKNWIQTKNPFKEESIQIGNWSNVPQQAVQQVQQAIPQVSQVQAQEPIASLDKIAKAIQVYGGQDAPLLAYTQQIANASTKYDLYKNNPYLIPVISHLETSSGRNVTRPNNLTNWGINYPGNNERFANMTQEQVLDRAISGMAERSPYYQQFRTGKPLTDEEIMALGKIYEPANNDYPTNLLNGIRYIESQLK
jgi:hypothetical protein